jgi:hypothetical protein
MHNIIFLQPSALVKAKEDKIKENMNLVSLQGLVLKDFMKSLKATVAEQIAISKLTINTST